MAAFPAGLKPSITQGYGFGQPDNIVTQQVQGGAPLQMLDYRTGPVPFNIGLSLNPLRLQVLQDFYFGKINSGTDKFTMALDSGNGIEEHTVMIVAGSFSINGDRAPIWTASFTVLAETTPFQENPFGGELVDLFNIYGDDLNGLLNQLEIFALEDLPS